MKNERLFLDKISECEFLNSFRNGNLIGEFVIGSDILNLRTEKSDFDLLFLYKGEEKISSSYDFNSRRCSSFLIIGGNMIQWKISSVLGIKKELLEKDRNKKDFSLLASLIKIGVPGAKIINIFSSDSVILKNIGADKKEMSICALHSFLESETVVVPSDVKKAFERRSMSAASSVNPKFWYTAFLGYNLLFGGSYDAELVKELKDFTYGQETPLIKENEQDIIDKVEACYEYYEKNFPKGVDNLIESVYNDIVKGN